MLEIPRSVAVMLFALVTATAADADGATGRLDTPSGRRIYAAQCASCHGKNAQGQPGWKDAGPDGDMPAPPHDAQGHTWKHSDAMLYRIVRDGWRDPFNKSSTLTMPAFGTSLQPAEIRLVLDYLKTLWTPEQRRFQREESSNAPYPAEARSSAPPKHTP